VPACNYADYHSAGCVVIKVVCHPPFGWLVFLKFVEVGGLVRREVGDLPVIIVSRFVIKSDK
jgi:hypothetical protein